MNLHHFFTGKLSREEVASAFLATILEQNDAFRKLFLKEMLDLDDKQCDESWQVKVEDKNIDICLDSDTIVVLIENKLSAGAHQKDQLLRYYRAAIKAHPNKRVIAVYLAPGGMGESERQAVCDSAEFKARNERDKCRRISWEELDKCASAQTNCSEFLSSGFREIRDAIQANRNTIYVKEGDRLRLSKVIDTVQSSLQTRFPKSRIGRWKGGNYDNIYMQKAKFAVWLMICYPIQDSPPHQPIVFSPDGKIQLRLATQFQLSPLGRRDPELARWWRSLCAAGEDHVYAEHALTGKWFKREVSFSGSETDVTTQLVSACQNVLTQLARGDAIVYTGSREAKA